MNIKDMSVNAITEYKSISISGQCRTHMERSNRKCQQQQVEICVAEYSFDFIRILFREAWDKTSSVYIAHACMYIFVLYICYIHVLCTTCLKTVVGASKGMVPVKYFCSNKASFCVSGMSWSSQDCHKVEVNLATLCFGDITRFKTVEPIHTYIHINIYLSMHIPNQKNNIMTHFMALQLKNENTTENCI